MSQDVTVPGAPEGEESSVEVSLNMPFLEEYRERSLDVNFVMYNQDGKVQYNQTQTFEFLGYSDKQVEELREKVAQDDSLDEKTKQEFKDVLDPTKNPSPAAPSEPEPAEKNDNLIDVPDPQPPVGEEEEGMSPLIKAVLWIAAVIGILAPIAAVAYSAINGGRGLL